MNTQKSALDAVRWFEHNPHEYAQLCRMLTPIANSLLIDLFVVCKEGGGYLPNDPDKLYRAANRGLTRVAFDAALEEVTTLFEPCSQGWRFPYIHERVNRAVEFIAAKARGGRAAAKAKAENNRKAWKRRSARKRNTTAHTSEHSESLIPETPLQTEGCEHHAVRDTSTGLHSNPPYPPEGGEGEATVTRNCRRDEGSYPRPDWLSEQAWRVLLKAGRKDGTRWDEDKWRIAVERLEGHQRDGANVAALVDTMLVRGWREVPLPGERPAVHGCASSYAQQAADVARQTVPAEQSQVPGMQPAKPANVKLVVSDEEHARRLHAAAAKCGTDMAKKYPFRGAEPPESPPDGRNAVVAMPAHLKRKRPPQERSAPRGPLPLASMARGLLSRLDGCEVRQ